MKRTTLALLSILALCSACEPLSEQTRPTPPPPSTTPPPTTPAQPARDPTEPSAPLTIDAKTTWLIYSHSGPCARLDTLRFTARASPPTELVLIGVDLLTSEDWDWSAEPPWSEEATRAKREAAEVLPLKLVGLRQGEGSPVKVDVGRATLGVDEVERTWVAALEGSPALCGGPHSRHWTRVRLESGGAEVEAVGDVKIERDFDEPEER